MTVIYTTSRASQRASFQPQAGLRPERDMLPGRNGQQSSLKTGTDTEGVSSKSNLDTAVRRLTKQQTCKDQRNMLARGNGQRPLRAHSQEEADSGHLTCNEARHMQRLRNRLAKETTSSRC